ncbi:MAG: carboxyl transferase domain-containing protein, partial [Aquihabitans sp.]
MTVLDRVVVTPIGADRPARARAELCEVDGRTVAYVEIDGRRADQSGAAEAEVVERGLRLAGDLGCPVLIVIRSVSVTPDHGGIDALVAWGRVAAAAVRISGVVPLLVAVTGAVHGSLTPLLGLADHVIVTRDATAYLNGPRPVSLVTGTAITPTELGGAVVHATRSGLAALVAHDHDDAVTALADLLAHFPDNHLVVPPHWPSTDSPHRQCPAAAAVVPAETNRSYDVREVLADVFDEGSVLEVYASHAPNLVTAYARLDGRSVAVVANQPAVRAGTLDIESSGKGARHVQLADAFGLPIVTFVDTPGYQPGRDLEWRGMIRHGAKLVHAYASASVPRVSVILRKAYGGAYIVMDSRTMGSDLVLAWPTAEIAVMGAPGAVAILHRRDLDTAHDPDARRLELEAAYRDAYCSPRIAAERGLVDEVIDPADTRR